MVGGRVGGRSPDGSPEPACRKCGSKLTGSVRQIKHNRNVWWLLVPLICLGFGVIEKFSGKTTFSVEKFYIATPILALIAFFNIYDTTNIKKDGLVGMDGKTEHNLEILIYFFGFI